MLAVGQTYRRNDGTTHTMGGKIKLYQPAHPYLWSLDGHWYHEQTGQVVSIDKLGCYILMDKDDPRSISNHSPVGQKEAA